MATLTLVVGGVGGLSIDLWTGKLSTGAHLRPLELRLLRTLVAHRGETVSQARLLVEAFDYAEGTRSRTLYTTVHRLRSAIEPDPSAPRYVIAERGGGYRLTDVELEDEPADAPLTNLEAEVDAFVGRTALLERLADLEVPLITLVGPGGSGKSRLAARHAADHPPAGGAWLARITDTRSVWASIVDALSSSSGGASSESAAIGRIRQLGRCLLILDDAEPALDDVRAAARAIRTGAPEARLVVTSREPLALAGEVRVDVGPLDEADAVALLVCRSAEVNPGCAATDEAWRELAELVDRLPLALELAAGRLGSFSPAELRDQLARSVDLHSTRADRPERHRSLGAVFEDTWSRLPDWEREALGRLSVLEGAFGVAAAEAVLGDRSGPDGLDAVSVLVSLRSRGLLATVATRDSKPFAQLRTNRALVARHTPPAIRADATARLDAFTADRASAAFGPGFDGLDGPAAFDGDQDPLGVDASLRRSLDRGAPLALEVALGMVGIRLGRPAEVEQRAAAALARDPDPVIRGELWMRRAVAAWHVDEQHAIAIFDRMVHDPELPVGCRFRAGHAAVVRWLAAGDAARAERGIEALDGLAAGGDLRMRPAIDANRARLCELRADPLGAIAAFERAEAGFRAIGRRELAAVMRAQIGQVLGSLHRWTEGTAALEAATNAIAALPNVQPSVEGFVVGTYGEACAVTRPALAEDLLQRAIRLATIDGAHGMAIELLASLAELRVTLGRPDAAAEPLARAIARVSAVADGHRVPVLRARAVVALATGDTAGAEEIAASAVHEADRLGSPAAALRAAAVLLQAQVAAGRLAVAAREVEARLAALPRPIGPPGGLVLDLAELWRWGGDR
ncbi:MAG: winged helix-turn-helix domain-containing protein, partial [Myxococcota bacterium]